MIRPEDIKKHFSENEQEIFASLEKAIDNELLTRQKDIQNQGPVVIKIGNTIPQSVQHYVVKQYESQGWNVEIIDARGGKCFRFSESKDLLDMLDEKVTDLSNKAKKFFNNMLK